MNACIDFEKDYLVIYRDLDGKFKKWEWAPHEKHSQEELDAMIIKFNEEQKTVEQGNQVELITDPLIREICAYRESSRPLERLDDCIKDFKESIGDVEEKIDDAIRDLENASRILNQIRHP